MQANIISQEDVKLLVKILRKYFLNVYKFIYLLDQKSADLFKQKNIYYYEEYNKCNGDRKKQHNHIHNHNHALHDNQSNSQCCSSFFSKIYIPEKEQTQLEQIVAEMFKKSSIIDHLPDLLNFIAPKFYRIKQSGIKDKLAWTNETEVYILNETMREGLQQVIIQQVKQELQKNSFIDSKQPMLLATPQTWIKKHPNIPLEFLSQIFLESLMKKGYGFQDNFIRNSQFIQGCYKELLYLEKEGKFEEAIQEISTREDKILWFSLSDLDKNQFKNLYFIAHVLSAIPYELNSKTQILAQISESFQISYFDQNRRYQKTHLDSSYDKNKDTGKKVSFLFFIGIDSDASGELTIELENEKISLGLYSDIIIGLMSRKIPYSIQINGSRAFLIRYWVDGPYETRTNY